MPNVAGTDWTRDEHILVFNLYWRLPFGKMHRGNPEVIKMSRLLGRTAGSISRKLTNFARLDPALQARGIRGSQHGAKGEEEVWREFANDPETLLFESTRLLAERLRKPLEEVAEIDTRDLPREGLEREAVVRLRVNQSVFRRRVISAYDFRCCVTGLAVPQLLTASHIVPWSIDPDNRLNLRNGLSLNALHDRAFDRGLMWIDTALIIHFSPTLIADSPADDSTLCWLTSFEGQSLRLPKRVKPDPILLRRHAAYFGVGE